MLNFDDELGAYTFETAGILFSWEEEPKKDYENIVKTIAENYKNSLPKIIEFMYPDIREMYGDITFDDLKQKLGKPIIDIDNGQVIYTEQTFDTEHIFSFEFLDNEFDEIQYFTIDG